MTLPGIKNGPICYLEFRLSYYLLTFRVENTRKNMIFKAENNAEKLSKRFQTYLKSLDNDFLEHRNGQK